MIETLDGLVLKRIAQPMVDALQLDPVAWPRRAARTASSAFVISCLGMAGIFAFSTMPFNALATIILGSTHVLSVRLDAFMGRTRITNPLAAFSRLFQLSEMLFGLWFVGYVFSSGSIAWTALAAVFLCGLGIANAVAYVSLCDSPPPRRRGGNLVPSRAGA